MCKEYDYVNKIEKAEEDIKQKVKAIVDKCPREILKKSKNIVKEYYRFKRHERDNYPYFLSNPELFRKREKNEVEKCKMCGLSVFENVEDVINLIKKFKLVYVMKVEANKLGKVGEIYDTPSVHSSSHRTFFPCINYKPEEVWEIYKKIQKS